MDIVIRRARISECDNLTELSIRSKRSNGYDDQFMAACREELTVTTNDIKIDEYWVADVGVICGCACLRADQSTRTGEIQAFFIEPDWQRKGIGRLLWQKLIERANALGLTRLHLDADPLAVPFYKSLGFELAGDVPSGSISGRRIPYMTISIA